MAHTAKPILKTKTIIGEGSLWDPKAQVLYWLDIGAQRVFVYDPQSGENKSFEIGGYPSSIVPRESGGVAITVINGYAALNLETGSIETLAQVEGNITANRFNDGKCDPAGRYWAGTMPFDLSQKKKGGLYRLEPDLSVINVLSEVSCSNGIVWSLDNQWMYYIDSLTQEVHRYDYVLETGNISNRKTVVVIPEKVGFPDGMAIDEAGNLWVALYQGGAVHCYHPNTGKLLDQVQVPGAELVTSCAFGGRKLKDLYITTACCEYSEEDWLKNPNAGNLFKVEMKVGGIPAVSFKG